MSVQSTARFALVCLLFVLFYHFTAFCTVIWLSLPLLCDLCRYLNKLDAGCQPTHRSQLKGYDAVKDAFEEIFATI